MKTQLNYAQQQILARLLYDHKLFYEYSSRLREELFVNEEYRLVFSFYKRIVDEAQVPDALKIAGLLGGRVAFEDLTALMKAVATDVSFESCLESLENHFRQNALRTLVMKLNDFCGQDDLEAADNAMAAHLRGNSERFNVVTFRQRVAELIRVMEVKQVAGSVTGIPSGISRLDSFSGGFQPTDLNVIAGSTSMGKTTLALQMAHSASVNGFTSAIFSIEMSAIQITARILAGESLIPSKAILKGRVEFDEFNRRIKTICDTDIYIDDCYSVSLQSILSKMRYYLVRHGVKFFVIDYLQIISHHLRGRSKAEELSDICRTLKNFARENEACIILLSQLNRSRDHRSSPRPTLSDLRGSGEIEESADNVLFVYRPEYYNIKEFEDGSSTQGMAELILDKGRNIGTARFRVQFIPQIPKFQNYEPQTTLPQATREAQEY